MSTGSKNIIKPGIKDEFQLNTWPFPGSGQFFYYYIRATGTGSPSFFLILRPEKLKLKVRDY